MEGEEGEDVSESRTVEVPPLADIHFFFHYFLDSLSDDGMPFHPTPQPTHPDLVHLPRRKACISVDVVERFIRQDLLLGREYEKVLRDGDSSSPFFLRINDQGPQQQQGGSTGQKPLLARMILYLGIVRIMELVGLVDVPAGYYTRPEALLYEPPISPLRPDFGLDAQPWNDGVPLLPDDEENVHEDTLQHLDMLQVETSSDSGSDSEYTSEGSSEGEESEGEEEEVADAEVAAAADESTAAADESTAGIIAEAAANGAQQTRQAQSNSGSSAGHGAITEASPTSVSDSQAADNAALLPTALPPSAPVAPLTTNGPMSPDGVGPSTEGGQAPAPEEQITSSEVGAAESPQAAAITTATGAPVAPSAPTVSGPSSGHVGLEAGAGVMITYTTPTDSTSRPGNITGETVDALISHCGSPNGAACTSLTTMDAAVAHEGPPRTITSESPAVSGPSAAHYGQGPAETQTNNALPSSPPPLVQAQAVTEPLHGGNRRMLISTWQLEMARMRRAGLSSLVPRPNDPSCLVS